MMIGYKSRLDKDLSRWQDLGWVTSESADAIRKDVAERSVKFGLAPILAILGAVLLCFAAMTFVAANWQAMSKLTRILILFATMWGSYGVAWVLTRNNAPALSQAAILLGVGLFGASIMLIAQMYHMEGNPPDAVLTWALGSFAAGILLVSRPALAVTVVLISLWSWWEVAITGEVHWAFLPVWIAVAAAMYWADWRPGYHLVSLSLAAWIVGLGYLIDNAWMSRDENYHGLVVVIGFCIIAAGIFLSDWIDRFVEFSKPIAAYGLAIAFAGLFSLQFIEKANATQLTLFAIVALALLIASLFYGWKSGNRSLGVLAYVGFSIELLALYFKTLGTLLDTALFFLVAGLIVIGLAWLAWYLHRHQDEFGEQTT